MKRHAYQLWLASAVFLCLATPSLSQEQITSDETLSTEVTTPDKFNFTITGGSQVEGNLFHSFREFSVPEGGSAFFNNPQNVDNIISRVTGGSISNINGLIQANPSANLFLINPKGIIFGPNARLEIGGSFLASTANRLNFGDGTFFSATDPQAQPLLSINVPIGLQFGENSREIINQSVAKDSSGNTVGFQVQPGKTLALVGANVFVEGGRLIAPAGRIELGSVAGTGLVSLRGWSLGYEGVQDFKDIKLSQGAFVDTNRNRFDTSGAGSGAIQLHGRQVVIIDRSVLGGLTLGAQPGDSVVINASEFVKVSNFSLLTTDTFGTGKAGDIAIKTPQLIVQDGGEIRASTRGFGQAGNITVDASESVKIIGSQSIISTQTSATDKKAGNAGIVQITTGKLSISQGGQIATSTFGAGDGGTLSVDASESVEVSGRSKDGAFSSALFAQSSGGKATGNAGMLKIDTRQLIVANGARISVGAVKDPRRGGVSTGQGGELKITASESVDVIGTGTNENGKAISSTLLAESQGPGAAGNLTIETDRLTVRDGAEVTVSSAGTRAGDLEVTADSIRLDNEGKLTATSESGEGGDIRLQDLGLLLLRNNSEISTTARGTKRGGDIKIDTDTLVGLENSDITANAFEGEGGFIKITAQGIFGLEVNETDNIDELRSNNSSDISAASQKDPSLNGEVEINRTEADISSGLVFLPTELVDISELIAQGCSAGGGNVARGASKFVATGRGGLPPTPTEALRSDAALADLGTPVQGDRANATISTNPTTSQPASIVEAQGWVIGPQGEVVLTAHAPSVTPHLPWLPYTSCNGS